MEEHGFVHKSVLLYETVGSLNIKPGGIYVDGTLGGGGHAYEVCKRLGGGRLIGIDQDADAIRAAGERLAPVKDKVTIVRSNYQNIENVLKELNIEKVDGIYLDLGVSSYQLDTADRGFTYNEDDAPLDMRMDQRQTLTASDIVNQYEEKELNVILSAALASAECRQAVENVKRMEKNADEMEDEKDRNGGHADETKTKENSGGYANSKDFAGGSFSQGV